MLILEPTSANLLGKQTSPTDQLSFELFPKSNAYARYITSALPGPRRPLHSGAPIAKASLPAGSGASCRAVAPDAPFRESQPSRLQLETEKPWPLCRASRFSLPVPFWSLQFTAYSCQLLDHSGASGPRMNLVDIFTPTFLAKQEIFGLKCGKETENNL